MNSVQSVLTSPLSSARSSFFLLLILLALPVVTSATEEGPIRCNRCRFVSTPKLLRCSPCSSAYINPHAQWDTSGQSYVCVFCGFTNEVPPHYAAPVVNGQRQDLAQRPELWRGSVEFVASGSYSSKERPPAPPSFLFLIDTSVLAVQQGLVQGAVVVPSSPPPSFSLWSRRFNASSLPSSLCRRSGLAS